MEHYPQFRSQYATHNNIVILIEYAISLQGDSLDSISSQEITITVEGKECVVSTIEASKGLVCALPPIFCPT